MKSSRAATTPGSHNFCVCVCVSVYVFVCTHVYVLETTVWLSEGGCLRGFYSRRCTLHLFNVIVISSSEHLTPCESALKWVGGVGGG